MFGEGGLVWSGLVWYGMGMWAGGRGCDYHRGIGQFYHFSVGWEGRSAMSNDLFIDIRWRMRFFSSIFYSLSALSRWRRKGVERFVCRLGWEMGVLFGSLDGRLSLCDLERKQTRDSNERLRGCI